MQTFINQSKIGHNNQGKENCKVFRFNQIWDIE